MEFTKVTIKDWYGVLGEYEIINLLKRDNGMYSCVYKNSNGDGEKVLVDEQCLR